MTTGRTQQIEVQDSAGQVLGHVQRHLRTSLWRLSGKAEAPVSIGGVDYRPSVRGRGAEATLVVRLPAGARLPKELEAAHG
jgi:hypothetical protein